jgi:hydrogenase-4 component F
MVASLWMRAPEAPGTWIGLDPLGLLFLSLTSVLFLAAAVYAVGYLRREPASARAGFDEGETFTNGPEAQFLACLLLFLGTMSLVALSRHMGLLWVAIEATTLASAPLIYFHRHHRSLEATWKYLLICSVGIALAMLGNFFLAVAGSAAEGGGVRLSLEALVGSAARLDPNWLQGAFILCLVGYGTKMGLAPMHTWLPDAHSEAPSMVSALLSGALLNCAFLGVLRMHSVMVAAGQSAASRQLLTVLGLVSLVVGAAFIIRQADFKRMLAYSSVEHMGILALGVGLGGAGCFGSLLHTVNHSLTKGALFLLAGNVLATFGTKSTAGVSNILRRRPLTGVLWIAGFLAICGSPPFGAFLSELTVLKAALGDGRGFVAAGYLAALGVVFVAMARIVLPMSYRRAEGDQDALPPAPEPAWSVLPPLILLSGVLVLGCYVPPWLTDMLQQAAGGLGGTP